MPMTCRKDNGCNVSRTEWLLLSLLSDVPCFTITRGAYLVELTVEDLRYMITCPLVIKSGSRIYFVWVPGDTRGHNLTRGHGKFGDLHVRWWTYFVCLVLFASFISHVCIISEDESVLDKNPRHPPIPIKSAKKYHISPTSNKIHKVNQTHLRRIPHISPYLPTSIYQHVILRSSHQLPHLWPSSLQAMKVGPGLVNDQKHGEILGTKNDVYQLFSGIDTKNTIES